MATQNVDLSINVGMRDDATKQVKHLESTIIRFVGAVSAALASLRLTIFPVTEAANFERAMKDVQKTTNFTDQEIKRLSASLRELATELAVDVTQLATIAATAGQLGLGAAGREAIESFTESVARASVTLNLVEQDAAEAGAVIANIFDIDPGNIERVFSAINELSNNSVASAKSLVDIIKRMGNTADVEFSKVAALSAYIKELGVPDEQAGTFLVKAFSNMLAEGEKFATAMGITQNEWIERVRSDAVRAFQDITQKLYEMDAGIRELSTKKLFGSGRLFSAANKVIADAANGQQKLAKFLDLSNKAYVEGTSSIREYETIVSATTEQYNILKNTINELSISLGTKLLPKLNAVIRKLQEFFKGDKAALFFDELAKAMDGAIDAVIGFGNSVSELEVPWGNLIKILQVLSVLGIAKLIISINRALVSQVLQVRNAALEYYNLAKARKAALASNTAVVADTVTSRAAVSTAPLLKTVASLDAAVRNVHKSFLGINNTVLSTNHALEGAIGVEKNRAALVADIAALEESRYAKGIAAQKKAYQLWLDRTRAERAEHVAAVGRVSELGEAEVAWWKRREAQRKAWYRDISALETEYTNLRLANTAKVEAAEKRITAARAVDNAYLAQQNAAFLAAQKRATGLSGLLAAMPAFIGKIGNVLKFVGVLALRIFTGWVGVALTGLYLFWDEIKGFFSFLTKKEEDAKARAIAAQKETAKALSDATALAAKASDSLSGEKTEVKGVVDFAALVDKESLSVVKSTVNGVVDEYVKLLKIQSDAKRASGVFSEALFKEATTLNQNKEELKQVTLKLKALEDEYERTAGKVTSRGTRTTDLKQRIDALTKQQVDLRLAIADSSDKVAEYQSNMDEANKTMIEASKLAKDAMVNVSQVYDEQIIKYIELKKKINDYGEALKEAEDKARTAKANLDLYKPVGDVGVDSAKIDELQYKYQQAEKSASELRRVMQGLVQESAITSKNIAAHNRELVKSLDTASKERIDLLAQNADQLRELSSNAVSLTERLKQQAPTIVATYLGWKRYRDEISKASSSLIAYKARVKGIFDNTGKEINALVASISEFSVNLDKIIHDRTIELKFKTDYDKKIKPKLDELDRQRKEVLDEYDPLIKQAEASGEDTTLLERLKKEALLRVDAKKHTIEQAAEQKKLNALIKDKIKLSKEDAEEAKRLSEIARKTGDQATANLALEYKDSAREGAKEVRALYEELANLTKISAFTGEETPLLSQSKIQQAKDSYRDLIRSINQDLSSVNSNVYKGAAKSAKPFEDAIEKANAQVTRYGSFIKELSGIYKGFGDAVEKLGKDIKDVIPDMDSLVSSVSKVTSEAFVGNTSATKEELNKLAKEFGDSLGKSVQNSIKNAEYLKTIQAAVEVEIPTEFQRNLKADMEKALKEAGANFTFEDGIPTRLVPDRDELQKELNKKPFDLPVNLVDPNGKPLKIQGTFSSVGSNFATGGFVRGPGTATSDSIPAWLSNGEYVIDAFTTGFFGSGFFKALQDMARNGIRASMKIPKFAQGGPVGADSIASILNGSGEVVTLNLNIGGATSTLYGERKQVKDFINAMHSIDKGL